MWPWSTWNGWLADCLMSGLDAVAISVVQAANFDTQEVLYFVLSVRTGNLMSVDRDPLAD